MESYMAYVWIAVALIMAVYEVVTVQLVTVWFFIGALCAAITTLFTDSIVIQLVVFVSVSVVTLIATRPLVKKFKEKSVKVSTNADRLIGSIGVMRTDLSEAEEIGQVKMQNGVWSARTDFPPIKEGDKVKVLAIDGVKLIVEKTE